MRLEAEETSNGVKQVISSKREHSSLDFKVRNRSPLTTTKPMKRKHMRQQEIEEEQMKQQAQQQQMSARRIHPSRARGNSGPPQIKLELSDLEGLSEEDIIQAIYTNPSLAQQAAEITEILKSDSASPAGAASKPRRSSGTRKPRKELSEYPDHMREMMDGGVPVVQWIILLVLLGAATYQLRKVLMLPDTKESNARGLKKGTTKKENTDLASLEETARSLENDRAAAKKDSKQDKKIAPVGKKKKSRAKSNNTVSKKQSPLDDSVGETKDTAKTVVHNITAPIQKAIANAAEDDDAGWQTVSKAKGSTQDSSAVEPSKKDSKKADKQPTSEPEPAKEPMKTKEAIEKENVAPVAAANGKKKKKKKSKSDPSETASSGQTSTPAAASTTTGDEILAKKLQQEEEKKANGSSGSPEDDVWEEVPTRKRKGSK